MMVLRKCPRCYGTGRILLEKSMVGIFLDVLTGEDDYTCPLCHGRGYIDDRTIEVRIRHDEMNMYGSKKIDATRQRCCQEYKTVGMEVI